ncbi:hypothetical protein FRC11_012630 [Ceratobasidium sp. 423]|nr:hypothetical protein FRC11_012630 [Ceratobasidium sp. 423]
MPKEDRMDLFQAYRCKNRDENYISKQVPGFLPASGFTYEIVTTQRDNPRFHALPSIWLASKSTGVFDTETLAPYLVPPFQPTVGLYTTFKAVYSQRKFIMSSPLLDALLGSKPAKLISPFGLFGKCTGDKAFRRRLWECYYRPPAEGVTPGDDRRVLDEENMDMSRFLLKFVIDMGPASPPAQTMTRD